MINKTHDKHMLLWKTLCHNHMLQGAEKNDNALSSFKIVFHTDTSGWVANADRNQSQKKQEGFSEGFSPNAGLAIYE